MDKVKQMAKSIRGPIKAINDMGLTQTVVLVCPEFLIMNKIEKVTLHMTVVTTRMMIIRMNWIVLTTVRMVIIPTEIRNMLWKTGLEAQMYHPYLKY